MVFFLADFVKEAGITLSKDNAEISFSFDPDGDRLKVFSAEGVSASGGDEKGEQIRGDVVGGIIADVFLKPGDEMVVDLVSTRATEEHFKDREVSVFRERVGHYFIKKTMHKRNSVFGSEVSGHYYFKHLHYAESTLFALLKILEALDKNPGLKISELAKPFLKFCHSGDINIPLSSMDDWEKILEKTKEKYKDGKQSFKDGILVQYPSTGLGTSDWWFNLRPSNTEPIMRLNLEAKTKELFEQKKKELLSFLNKISV